MVLDVSYMFRVLDMFDVLDVLDVLYAFPPRANMT